MTRTIAIYILVAWAALPVRADELVAGSKKFTESVVLGEIARQLLVSEGFDARHLGELGGTRIVFEALVAGEVDVYVEYTGRMNMESGFAYSAPTFRTGDPRYAWLNGVQAVAKGEFDREAMVVTYPVVYELR